MVSEGMSSPPPINPDESQARSDASPSGRYSGQPSADGHPRNLHRPVGLNAHGQDSGGRAERAPTPELETGQGHILLVDDDKLVRSFMALTLSRLGYRVTAMGCAIEALDYYREHSDHVDLVILDLVMPRMGGDEAFRSLIQIDPAVKVILASGCGRAELVEQLLAEGARGFLQKPFHLEDMARMVAEHVHEVSVSDT